MLMGKNNILLKKIFSIFMVRESPENCILFGSTSPQQTTAAAYGCPP
jgi:hypothetical protein